VLKEVLLSKYFSCIFIVRSNCAILNFEGKYDGNRRNKGYSEKAFLLDLHEIIFSFVKNILLGRAEKLEAIPGEHSLLLTASYEPSTDRRKRIMHTSTRLRIKEWSERIYCIFAILFVP
jgi:hypothetical protein